MSEGIDKLVSSIEIGDLVRYMPPQKSTSPIIGIVIGKSSSLKVFPHLIINVKWQQPIPGWGITDGWYPFGNEFYEVTKI
jgi:hypothetical protein